MSSSPSNSISSLQACGGDHDENVVSPCSSTVQHEETIGLGDFIWHDFPHFFQHLPEFEGIRLHDLPQHCQTQGCEEIGGAYVEDSNKGKQPLEEGQSYPPEKCCTDHDSTGKRRACERKRRKRINAKLKNLQELIPHSEKNDQASILDDAINYIKSLKLQVDMMSSPGVQLSPMTGYGPGQFQMGPLMVGPAAGGGGFGFQVQSFPMPMPMPIPMQSQVAAAVTPATMFFPATTRAPTTTFAPPFLCPQPPPPPGSPDKDIPRFQSSPSS